MWNNLRIRRNRSYIYDQPGWPEFTWKAELFQQSLASVHVRRGALIGKMEALGFQVQQQTMLESVTQEVRKSSEIEGEILDEESIRSSVGRRLGIKVAGISKPDQAVEGVVEMTLDATQQFAKPLTVCRLSSWHTSLFPNAPKNVLVGRWRDDRLGPMQVISGGIGHERVHFQALAASRIPEEMSSFLKWANRKESTDRVVRAAIAHLWFVTIHPYDDGNGRIARAITELMLARSENSADRFYSMSAQIRKRRSAYYAILEKTQNGGLDISDWIEWFIACLTEAVEESERTLSSVLERRRFWEKHATEINSRQRKMLNVLLDSFSGKLTSSKWAKMTKCSQDTALRDIIDLIDKGMLVKDSSGGRSTTYSLPSTEG